MQPAAIKKSEKQNEDSPKSLSVFLFPCWMCIFWGFGFFWTHLAFAILFWPQTPMNLGCSLLCRSWMQHFYWLFLEKCWSVCPYSVSRDECRDHGSLVGGVRYLPERITKLLPYWVAQLKNSTRRHMVGQTFWGKAATLLSIDHLDSKLSDEYWPSCWSSLRPGSRREAGS